MAFDKNNTTLGMKIVIIFFAVVLIVSMCLPFFTSCSTPAASSTDTSSADDSASSSTSSTTGQSTAAEVDATYQTQIDSLKGKLDSDPKNPAAIANLGNAYMDWGQALQAASDADSVADHVKETFQSAVDYYDQFLESNESNAVTVDRACSLYYTGAEDEAIADLEEFTQTNDSFSPAWANLGVFYELKGETDKATDAYNKAISCDANDSYGVSDYCQLRLMILQANAESSTGSTSDATADTSGDATTTGTAAATDGSSTSAPASDTAASTSDTSTSTSTSTSGTSSSASTSGTTTSTTGTTTAGTTGSTSGTAGTTASSK